MLQQFAAMPVSPPYTVRSFYALDKLWRSHQLVEPYWAALPALAKQRASYSDIMEEAVDYGC